MTIQEFFDATVAKVTNVIPCECPIIMADNSDKALGTTFFDADMNPIRK